MVQLSDGGWIKLHRKIINNWIWDDPEKLRAWLDILLMVNHEDKKTLVNGNLVVIHRGERLTSISKLAVRWGWSRQRVRNFLDLLEQDEMCTTIRTTNGTTIKLSNYADYQDFQKVKRTTNFTTDVTADVTADLTADVTADVTQTRMIKNYKEGKEIYRASAQFVPPSLSEVSDYCLKRGNGIDANEFCDFYEARGWKLSKGLVMRDWKAAVRGWEKRQQKTDDRFDNHPKQREHYEDLDKELFGI